MNGTMIFDGWASIARTLVVGVLAYVALVVLLRASGKRTLAKMNAFDFVVTVALGSTLATILLSKDVSLAAGVAALGVLIAMQYAVAWLSVRFSLVRRFARSEPRLLVRRGQVLKTAMVDERVSTDEVLAAIRNEGLAEIERVDALILETDGSFSVIPSAPSGESGAFEAVRGHERT
jgi:uncharacterized membrane protein YcaP (DUF421 family)